MWQLKPKLYFQTGAFETLRSVLHNKTEGVHESGGFLLGTRKGRKRFVRDVVFYDDLCNDAYSSGICILQAKDFGLLWRRCEKLGLEVVADIHVHPCGAWQSESDRTNPMIASKGHLALILPDFAQGPVAMRAIGMFEYLGRHQWRSLGGWGISRRIIMGYRK